MILHRMPKEQRVTSSQVGNALHWMLYSLVEGLCRGKTNCSSTTAGKKLHKNAGNGQMDSLMCPAINAFALEHKFSTLLQELTLQGHLGFVFSLASRTVLTVSSVVFSFFAYF